MSDAVVVTNSGANSVFTYAGTERFEAWACALNDLMAATPPGDVGQETHRDAAQLSLMLLLAMKQTRS